MDIKIISTEANTSVYRVNKDICLMIKSRDSQIKSGGSVIPFSRADYFLYHVKKNVREEILPEFEKYIVADISSAENSANEIYFFHIEYTTYPNAAFCLYSYNIHQQICREIYRFTDNIKLYENDRKIHLFVLNSNYFLLQFAYAVTSESGKYRGFLKYKSFLYDRANRMKFDIFDERISKGGIQQLIPVAPNVCAVRIGYNVIDDNRYELISKAEAANETIGLISVPQFIGNLLLKLPCTSMEIIDEVCWDKTFSPIKIMGRYVAFFRISRDDFSQEILFYQFITKETIMILNKNVYSPQKLFPCVLLRSPYLVRVKKKCVEFYDIGSNTVAIRLPAGLRLLDICNDYLILSSTRKSLFKKSSGELVEILQFEGMKLMYKEKLPRPVVFSTSSDNLLLFIQEEHDQ